MSTFGSICNQFNGLCRRGGHKRNARARPHHVISRLKELPGADTVHLRTYITPFMPADRESEGFWEVSLTFKASLGMAFPEAETALTATILQLGRVRFVHGEIVRPAASWGRFGDYQRLTRRLNDLEKFYEAAVPTWVVLSSNGCRKNLFDVDDVGGIVAGVARAAIRSCLAFATGFFQSREGKIRERVGADIFANRVDGFIGCDELVLRRRIDSVVTRRDRWGTRNPHVHFLRTRAADHADDLSASRAAHN